MLEGSQVEGADQPADRAGPEALCRTLFPRLVGALTLYLGDRAVAEELAQDALSRVVERWDGANRPERPDAWVFRVALNLARSAVRRRAAERRAWARHGRPAPEAPGADAAEAIAVRAALASLPARQRQAVVLRYYGDLSLDQVAASMGCTAGTVKAHLHKAMTRLRTAGLTDEEEG